MATEQRILKVGDVVLNEKFYPRGRTSWITSYKYSQAMKEGVKFPPIIVAEHQGMLILVDGWHRVEATKLNKGKHIQAEILKGLGEKEILIQAIKYNVEHGLPLSSYDVARSIIRLQEMKVSMADISSLLHISEDKLQPFVSKRITHGATGEMIVLKRTLRHLSSTDRMDVNTIDQDNIGGSSQVFLLTELKTMIENDWLNLKSREVKELVWELHELLAKLVKKVDKPKPKRKYKKRVSKK